MDTKAVVDGVADVLTRFDRAKELSPTLEVEGVVTLNEVMLLLEKHPTKERENGISQSK